MGIASTTVMASRATGWRHIEAAATAGERHGNRAQSEPPKSARDRAMLQSVAAEVRTALEEAAVAANAAAAAVAAANRARSVAEALVVPDAADVAAWPMPLAAHPRTPCAGAISPREREVLALVATGRTNKAIAESLFVSPNTVKTHVASLLTKLQADSRVQLATIANIDNRDLTP